jgi:hypothetical protein
MKSTGYPNALLLRRQQHHVALYLWNMSPSRAPLPGRDYTCVPNLYSCAAFQDHPTFYSNLDVFPYPGECSRHGNVHLVKEAKTKYINKNNIPIAATELANPIFFLRSLPQLHLLPDSSGVSSSFTTQSPIALRPSERKVSLTSSILRAGTTIS